MKVPRFTTQDLRNSNLFFNPFPFPRARGTVSAVPVADGVSMPFQRVALDVSDFCHIFVKKHTTQCHH